MQVKTPLLSACLLAGLTVVNLPASPIFGVFNLSGNITVSPTTIDWFNIGLTPTPQTATIGAGDTGSFAVGFDATTVTIMDLNTSTEPVGPTFGPDQFISFNAFPLFPTLAINMIFPGYSPPPPSGLTGCPGIPFPPGPVVVGQTCTPSANSPFTFTNTQGGQSNASFTFAGVTSDGGTWIGNFSADFTVPYQTVLEGLSKTGTVTDTFAGTITVTSGSTPEPDSWYMAASGLALVLLSLGTKRFFRRQQQ
jgi:hypothetical protein